MRDYYEQYKDFDGLDDVIVKLSDTSISQLTFNKYNKIRVKINWKVTHKLNNVHNSIKHSLFTHDKP